MPSGIYKRTKPPWNKDKKRSEQTKRKIRKKMKGRHSSLKTEFKQGSIPWNKDTKGVMKVNKTSFKKGEHFSVSTEFKKGEKKSKEFKKSVEEMFY